MDLFDYMRQTNQEKEAPLAARLRPRTLDEVVGQQHIIGKDKLLYRAIQADKLSSIIFYGPPGTGKTTLARVIANTTSAEFMQINATVAGKKDMEEVVAKAKDNRGMFGKISRSADKLYRCTFSGYLPPPNHRRRSSQASNRAPMESFETKRLKQAACPYETTKSQTRG